MKKKIESLNNTVLTKNPDKWKHRIIIGTPTTGTVRMEWVHARYGQIIPTAWSQVEYSQWMGGNIPLGYEVADAYNLICKAVVEQGFEWLLTIESDNILPMDCFVRLNQYMIEKKVPVVSGLYFTKSDPPEPLVYRGSGWGHFDGWKLGDKVWASGIPNGCTLIHASIIRALWNKSPEYITGGVTTRRVFVTPNEIVFDPEKGMVKNTGTQDLHWCNRVMNENIFEEAGWPEYQGREFPFLVDTNIFIKHITPDGTQYPLQMPPKFIPEKGYKPKEIID